jgi:excisionase family DNA binding protein
MFSIIFPVSILPVVWKVSYRTVYCWVRAGKLPAYKFGTDWRVKVSDLRDFVEAHRAEPDEV